MRELTDEMVEALAPVFGELQQKLRVANGSLRSALRDVDEWRDAAVARVDALKRTQQRVDAVTEKAKAKIVDLKRRAISCCFCGCDNESLEALKAHSAVCPQHPAVQRLNARMGFDDTNLEKIRDWDIAVPGALFALFDFVTGIWNRDYGAIRLGLCTAHGDLDFCAPYKNFHFVQFITGGWSENEEILRALSANYVAYASTWRASFSGGLHIFEIPKCEEKTNETNETK